MKDWLGNKINSLQIFSLNKCIWSISFSNTANLSLNYLYFHTGQVNSWNWTERKDVILIAYLISIIKLLIWCPLRITINVSDK